MAYAGYQGYKKGLVVEVVNTLGLVLAILAGFMLLDMVMQWIKPFTKGGEPLLPFIAFAIIFFGVIWAVRKLGKVARQTLRYTLFGTLDAAAGAALGILKISFSISTILWLIALIGIRIPDVYTRHTLIYPVVAKIGPGSIKLFGILIPFLKELPQIINRGKYQG